MLRTRPPPPPPTRVPARHLPEAASARGPAQQRGPGRCGQIGLVETGAAAAPGATCLVCGGGGATVALYDTAADLYMCSGSRARGVHVMHGQCAAAVVGEPHCPACVDKPAPGHLHMLQTLKWELYVRVGGADARGITTTNENRIDASWRGDRIVSDHEFIVPLPPLAPTVRVTVMLRARLPGGALFRVAGWQTSYEAGALEVQLLRLEGADSDCVSFALAPPARFGTPSLHVTAFYVFLRSSTAVAAIGNAQWQSDRDPD